MQNFKKKTLIILVTAIIGLLIWWSKETAQSPTSGVGSDSPEVNTPEVDKITNEKPRIVSTKPDPLEEAIVPATDTVEITFNRPLENVGEFKVRIEPKIDFKAELSGDRKTAKIIPLKPLELGSGYTLFIGTETKFDGVGRWGEEKIFHFRTIRYRGI